MPHIIRCHSLLVDVKRSPIGQLSRSKSRFGINNNVNVCSCHTGLRSRSQNQVCGHGLVIMSSHAYLSIVVRVGLQALKVVHSVRET